MENFQVFYAFEASYFDCIRHNGSQHPPIFKETIYPSHPFFAFKVIWKLEIIGYIWSATYILCLALMKCEKQQFFNSSSCKSYSHKNKFIDGSLTHIHTHIYSNISRFWWNFQLASQHACRRTKPQAIMKHVKQKPFARRGVVSHSMEINRV